MKVIAKTQPGPGVEIIEREEPTLRPGHVKVRIERGSVCGTDLHIYKWDPWAAHRIHPPRIIGHEFCGTVVEVADGVSTHQPGDFIASESHIVCGYCPQCLAGQGHVCVNTRILGVDVDGGFGAFAVIPSANARKIPDSIPREAASMLDAVGNGVHTALAGPVEGRTILITGLGPIGLFAAAVCRAMGARQIIGTEVSPYRLKLAKSVGLDRTLNPMTEDVPAALREMAPTGVDATLEMSGHSFSLALAIHHTRPGGRISLLGVYPDNAHSVDINEIIFKGLDVQGIVGRRLWGTWDQMEDLFVNRGLDISPIITHHINFRDISSGMETLSQGMAGKIVIDFQDAV